MFFRVFIFLMVIAVVIVESDAALQCRGGRYRNDTSLIPESWKTCDESVKFCMLDIIVEQRKNKYLPTVLVTTLHCFYFDLFMLKQLIAHLETKQYSWCKEAKFSRKTEPNFPKIH